MTGGRDRFQSAESVDKGAGIRYAVGPTVVSAPTEGPLDPSPEVTPEQALDPAPAVSLDLLQQCRRCGSTNGTERGTFHRTIHRSRRGSSSGGAVSLSGRRRTGSQTRGATGATPRDRGALAAPIGVWRSPSRAEGGARLPRPGRRLRRDWQRANGTAPSEDAPGRRPRRLGAVGSTSRTRASRLVPPSIGFSTCSGWRLIPRHGRWSAGSTRAEPRSRKSSRPPRPATGTASRMGSTCPRRPADSPRGRGVPGVPPRLLPPTSGTSSGERPSITSRRPMASTCRVGRAWLYRSE